MSTTKRRRFSKILSIYQYDLVLEKREAKKFQQIADELAGDILDKHNKKAWLKDKLEELYLRFCEGQKITKSDFRRP